MQAHLALAPDFLMVAVPTQRLPLLPCLLTSGQGGYQRYLKATGGAY